MGEDISFSGREFRLTDEEGGKYDVTGEQLLDSAFLFSGIQAEQTVVDKIMSLKKGNKYKFTFLGVHPGEINTIKIKRTI